MTPEHQNTFKIAFHRWFKGDELAVRACLDVMEIAHLWDDLVDRDQTILSAVPMRKAMLDLPSNPFWYANQPTLLPVLQSIYFQWSAANELEKSDEQDDHNKAYMLRASLYQLFHTVAALCGGIDWATHVGPEIYRMYGEKFEDMRAKNA